MKNNSTIQDWVFGLSLMQQAVLLSSLRGPDGIKKYHKCKGVIKWFRRSILISAFDKKTLDNPCEPGGGSFTGPSVMNFKPHWEEDMGPVLDNFLVSRDELPYHYIVHFMHSAEILGYKHPNERIRKWWNMVYLRMVNSLHLYPESEEQMDLRLGDDESQWLERSDEAGSCSE